VWDLELGLNGIFLGLNRIDFFGICRILNLKISEIQKIQKNQSYLIQKKSYLILIPTH
jgi:hypothetical protein